MWSFEKTLFFLPKPKKSESLALGLGDFFLSKKIVLLKIQVYNESSRPLNYLEGPLGSQMVLVTLHNA